MSNAKILVFASSQKRICDIATALDGFVLMGNMTEEYKSSMINRFNYVNAKNEAGGINTLVCDRGMITGWRAPRGTLVLFDRSALDNWSKEEIGQAMGRERVFE